MDALDIKDVALPEIVEWPLVNKNGDKTATVFLLAGPGHPARVSVARKTYRRTARDYNKRGKVAIPEDLDPMWEEETDRLVALTLGWRELLKDGAELPYSPEAARALYENRDIPIRKQIAEALIKIGDFMPDSSSN